METSDRGIDGVVPAAASVSMPGARLVTTKVAAEQTGGAYSLFEVEVESWGGEGAHVQHREDECVYVLEGRFGFLVEGVETEAGPGEHLYVPKGALHAYRNTGDATGRLLTIHTPGGPQERFVEGVGVPATGPGVPPAPGPRPNREEFVLLAAEHGLEICEKTEQIERSF